MTDEEQVQSSTEEATETTEAQETETTEEQSSSDTADTGKDYRKIADDQRRRAEKAERDLKALKEKPAASVPGALSPEAQQRFDRIELNSLGVRDREEQDFVLGAAKRMGVEPSQAVSDDIISAKLEDMRKKRATKDATPAPTRGAGASTSNVTKLAEKALQTGELPTDPELKAKVRAEMARLTRK